MSHGMQRQGDEADDQDEFEEEGFSLEELSQTYAKLQPPAGQAAAEDFAEPPGADGETGDDEIELFPTEDDPAGEADEHCPVTALSIVEAVLLVGRPDSKPITAEEIASLMRGVDAAEVVELIAEINRMYADTGRAFRIAELGIGYRLQLADDLSFMADRFYGRVREVKLNQAAIDCLALVLYQPGIARDVIDEQRGQPSSSILNQLVRRQLLEMRREGEGARLSPHYYPTERLLELAGLASLEDLPQVEEWS